MAVFWCLFALLVTVAVWLGISLAETIPAPIWVRVYGAPPEASYPLVLRVSAESAAPASLARASELLSVRVVDGEMRTLEQSIRLGSDLSAIITLKERLLPPISLRVTWGKETLAEGRLRLPSRWADLLRMHPGRIQGKVGGAVRIGAGIREGRFILGQPSQLLVQTSDLEGEAISTEVTLETQGLDVTGPGARYVTRTNTRGRASVTVIPRDFTVSLKLLSSDANAKTGEFFAEVPVEATAFRAKKDRLGIEVESLIPSDVLDYAIVTERGLWARGTLSLQCTESHNCRGHLPQETLPEERAWLILGREPALDGASNVGWSLDDCDGPCSTVTFREAMLLDGKPIAMAAYRQAESNRRRRILTVSAVTGGAFLGALAWLLLRVIARGRSLTQSQAEENPLPLKSLRIGVYWLVFLSLAIAAIGAWISSRALH